MPQSRRAGMLKRVGLRLVILAIMGMISIAVIPLRLAITLRQVPHPQAILVLEGNPDRVAFAAQFAQAHADLPIWVSGNPGRLKQNQRLFQQAGIAAGQVRYDFCATDTVTNFTCNVTDFSQRHIRHVYLITSEYHMARSRSIAALVLGSRGIAVTPVPVQSEASADSNPPESPLRIVRDCLRSLLWLATGWTGARLKPELWQR